MIKYAFAWRVTLFTDLVLYLLTFPSLFSSQQITVFANCPKWSCVSRETPLPGNCNNVPMMPHYFALSWPTILIIFPRALCDGPCSGVSRQVLNFKQLQLTKFLLKLGPGARTSTVTKQWEKDDINAKWAETSWAKRQQNSELRAAMSDFDRLVTNLYFVS